jgi:hypothetical protein
VPNPPQSMTTFIGQLYLFAVVATFFEMLL